MPSYQLETPSSEPSANRSEASVVAQARAELDQYFAALRDFENCDITEILRSLAAFSARASEIRSHMMRNESRRIQSFRTRELDPFIEELDRQFKVWSRYQAVREMEFKMSGGGI